MVLRQALVHGLQPYKARVRTLTYDEGLEFSEQVDIAQDLEAQIYFARPYGSWEQGVNEHTNQLIRFPKNRDWSHVTEAE